MSTFALPEFQYHILLVVHAAATWFMVGLIWIVQIVHYPLFANVGQDSWGEYHRLHSSKITLVVAPMMLIELACAVAVWLCEPTAWRDGWTYGGVIFKATEGLPEIALGVLGLCWACTFFVQVPIHAKLAEPGNDHSGSRRLIRNLTFTNWARTVLWTLRGIGAGYMLLPGG